MTLINYLSRVHFADSVLEDALHSEMERNQCTRPLVVFQNGYAGGTDFLDRLISGFPYRSEIALHPIPTGRIVEADIQALNVARVSHKADVVIAFGNSNAIAIGGWSVSSADRDGAAQNINTRKCAPYFFAVPGIENLPTFHANVQILADETFPKPAAFAQPDVIICDPTLTVGETPQRTASAAVTAMVRCVEAYVSDAFNPPADGIALDGVIRTAQNLHSTIATDTLDGRRELMAASLNGMLAQQKSVGIIQSLASALAHDANDQIDHGAISRLLLPAVLEFQATDRTNARYDQLKSVFNIPLRMSLPEGLKQFLTDLPLPQSLSELGLTQSDIQRTIRSAQISWGTSAITEEILMPLLAPPP